METYHIIFEDEQKRINKIWINAVSKPNAINEIKKLTSDNIRIIVCSKVV